MRIISNAIVLLFCANCFAQDSVVMKVPVGQATGMASAVMDTNNVAGFTNKVKGLISWANLLNKPDLTAKVNATDTTGMLAAYLSALIARMKYSDTASLLVNYKNLMIASAAAILLKYNISDTAAGLINYRLSMIANAANILLKVNISDTANAFINYRTAMIAAAAGILLKVNISDTATAFNNYRLSMIANTAALLLKANSASPTITGTAALPIVTMSGKITNYNSIATVSNGVPSIVATIDATTQAANIATATLYAVPSAGFYRVNIYITITQAATTSSTMPSTTITYTDGNAGTNAHTTTTTATNAGNSVTTSFLQTTYLLYAKTSTNIQYATAGYVSTGATPMQYALRIRVEAL